MGMWHSMALSPLLSGLKTFPKMHTWVTPSPPPEPVRMERITQAVERNTSSLHCSSEKVIIHEVLSKKIRLMRQLRN